MEHLLGIEGLSRESLLQYLQNAQTFIEVSERELKKVPALRGKTIINLFLESSTRTRVSFEIAAKRLSADAVNVGSSDSSITKGETLLDTARTLQSMAPDIIVMRHKESGAPHFLARHIKNCSIVNAGDGTHEHPTQALLDCLTLMQRYGRSAAELSGLKISIVGDVLHSRVARSNIWAHILLGNQVTLVAPPALVPAEFCDKLYYGDNIRIEHDLVRGIAGADVVMCLRMQLERQGAYFVPDLEEYSRVYCVSEKLLAKHAPNSVVLHPGPSNRGTEASSDVLDGPRSLVESQVKHGVAARMATLFTLATKKREELN